MDVVLGALAGYLAGLVPLRLVPVPERFSWIPDAVRGLATALVAALLSAPYAPAAAGIGLIAAVLWPWRGRRANAVAAAAGLAAVLAPVELGAALVVVAVIAAIRRRFAWWALLAVPLLTAARGQNMAYQVLAFAGAGMIVAARFEDGREPAAV